jgi:hypothetical protein
MHLLETSFYVAAILLVNILVARKIIALRKSSSSKSKSTRELLLLDLLELIKKLKLVYLNAPKYNNAIVEALDELTSMPLIYIEGIYLTLVRIANLPNPEPHMKTLNETILLAELIVRNYKYETWFTCHKRNSPHIIPMLKVGVCVKSDLGVSEINKELQLFSK